ncbi:hypothetical protein NQ317_008399 [Molorchus minor]|uniref:Uncharacterized protein n=1 Tax=Molorchus minor TaxID=1323400 RepID=A0ABQ9K469_9CUCU|nr:hypothetical protein NQ317_008399 [Molorchus minor]
MTIVPDWQEQTTSDQPYHQPEPEPLYCLSKKNFPPAASTSNLRPSLAVGSPLRTTAACLGNYPTAPGYTRARSAERG